MSSRDCKAKIASNSILADALPMTPLGSLQHSPRPPSGFKGRGRQKKEVIGQDKGGGWSQQFSDKSYAGVKSAIYDGLLAPPPLCPAFCRLLSPYVRKIWYQIGMTVTHSPVADFRRRNVDCVSSALVMQWAELTIFSLYKTDRPSIAPLGACLLFLFSHMFVLLTCQLVYLISDEVNVRSL